MRCSLIAFLLLLVTGCSGQRGPDPATAHSAGEVPLFGIPSPSELRERLPRNASYAADDLTKAGGDFETNLPRQNVSKAGSTGAFTPDWDSPAKTDFGGLSFATYLYSIKGYAGLPTLTYAWAAPPTKPGNAYFALANWNMNRWDWYRGNQNGVIFLPGTSRYLDLLGNMLVCVMRVGTDESDLASMRLGSIPPAASLSTNAGFGLTPLVVNFDASGSSDSDGSIVEYEWDPEGDGVFESSTGETPGFSFTYTTPGIYRAAVRATDNTGSYGEAVAEVKVTSGISFTYGSPTSSELVQSLVVADDGSLCVFGAVFASGGSDVMYFKVEPDGSAGHFAKSWGGPDSDAVLDACKSHDGTLWACGYMNETVINTDQGVLQHWDAEGNLLSSKRVYSTNFPDTVTLRGIAMHGDSIYVCGEMYLDAIAKRVGLLIKLDPLGNIAWAHSIIAQGDCQLSDVQFQENFVTGATSVRACGFYQTAASYDAYYTRFSEDGDQMDSQVWGTDGTTEFASHIFLTGNGNAATYLQGATGAAGGFVVRFGGNGVDILHADQARGAGMCATPAAPVTAIVQNLSSTGIVGLSADVSLLSNTTLSAALMQAQYVPVSCQRYSQTGIAIAGYRVGEDEIASGPGDNVVQASAGTWKQANSVMGSPSAIVLQDTTMNVTDLSGFTINIAEDLPESVPWIYIGRNE